MPQTNQLSQAELITLNAADVSLVLHAPMGERPRIIYWGPRLVSAAPNELTLLSTRQFAHGGPTIDIAPSLLNEPGAGRTGPPGLLCHREGAASMSVLRTKGVAMAGEATAEISCEDEHSSVCALITIGLDEGSGLLAATTTITNNGSSPLAIDWCAALCLPVDETLTEILSFRGRWAMEFQEQATTVFRGSYLRENRSGRTSHDHFPGFILKTPQTGEASGLAAGFHLAWSGNSRMRLDQHSDGLVFAQAGELFLPGEIRLAPGASYTTPKMYAAHSNGGLNGVSRQFHRGLLNSVMHDRLKAKPRPVHYNTWEAIYFDFRQEKIEKLAEKAAAIGAERFVLDDGWFGSRRNDRSGLGDWTVSKDIFPNGLRPLADKVRALGMEFGLWFEPEMVNPDSDLYRQHPDWVLEAAGISQTPARNQYVLNLTRKDVFDRLLEAMSRIISECGASYIKWDMNRDIHHPFADGRPVANKQISAVYKLMEELKRRHPTLEIESCASGGGRADFGVLRHADRIWLSDSNDALDRQAIQRGASHFFPLAVTGAHVGPARCHVTGRNHSMAFRAATAFLGHMGVEADLFAETDADLKILSDAISLYKKHRALLHSGDLVRLETGPDISAAGVVSHDQGEGVFSCAYLRSHATTLPGRLRFDGLKAEFAYRLRLIWPSPFLSVTAPSIVDAADLCGSGSVFSGDALMKHGLQLPLTNPESCLIMHLEQA